jgi:hypothetical protein
LRIQEDPATRAKTIELYPAPAGEAAFQDGYRECIELFALHMPNRRAGRILDEYCITLEQACIANPSRKNYAAYEGFRQAIKDLKKHKKIK